MSGALRSRRITPENVPVGLRKPESVVQAAPLVSVEWIEFAIVVVGTKPPA
jgi:hypothetical protein